MSCTALELVPQTPAARARTHPVGMTLREPPRQAGRALDGTYGLRPVDLHHAYALPNEAPSSQTIALVDSYDNPAAEEDLKVYDEEFGLPPCTTANHCFQKINQAGQTAPLPSADGEWAEEIALDIEMARAICQNCHILLVEANSESGGDLAEAERSAVEAGATEVSNSYAGPQYSALSSFDYPGVVITAASGDWEYDNWSFPYLGKTANFPAASPYVIAVGGTQLHITEFTQEPETVWSYDGSGCSSYAAPSWQQAVSDWTEVGCGSHRAVADVAADASPFSGVAMYDSYTSDGSTGWSTAGGTSVSSPIIAATFALAGGSGGVEYPAETLYSHIGSSALHDVVSGSDWTQCSHQLICEAAPGYDGPTGVGTPNGIGAFSVDPGTIPSVTSTTPAEGATAGGRAVVISGANLANATLVRFGAAPAQITEDTATKITALAPEHAPGTVDVTVTGSTGVRSATTSEDRYNYVVPQPVVSGVTPDAGTALGGTPVTISGSHLGEAEYVDFGGYQAPMTTRTESTITVLSPPHARGGVDVTVTAPYGTTSATSTLDRYTYLTPPATVTAVTPPEGPTSGGTTVTISGASIGEASAVEFGGVPATIVGESEQPTGLSTVTAVTPAHAAGAVDVAVATPLGAALDGQYTYTSTKPPKTSPSSNDAGQSAITSTLPSLPVLTASLPPPSFSDIGLSGRSFRAGDKPILSFTLSAASSVVVSVMQSFTGHITHRSCVLGDKRGRACALWASRRRFHLFGAAGVNHYHLDLANLGPGRYEVSLTATGNSATGAPVEAFTLTPNARRSHGRASHSHR